jgi:hypothetical protein
MQVRKATIHVEWSNPKRPKTPPIEVQYNPTDYTLEKGAQIAEVQIPGIDSPLQQFVRGNAEKLTLDLFFDTSDSGMGPRAVSVTTKTDRIYELIKIEPERHAPPILTFIWGKSFPGSSIGDPAADAASAWDKATTAVGGIGGAIGGAVAAVSAFAEALSGRRNGFRCLLENIKQKFTLFSSEGVPLRATLTVTLREYVPLADQLKRLHLSSPDKTHGYVTERGDSWASISHRFYETPFEWRRIASENDVEDPRRFVPGRFVRVPRID